jgi:hypothetical protein
MIERTILILTHFKALPFVPKDVSGEADGGRHERFWQRRLALFEEEALRAVVNKGNDVIGEERWQELEKWKGEVSAYLMERRKADAEKNKKKREDKERERAGLKKREVSGKEGKGTPLKKEAERGNEGATSLSGDADEDDEMTRWKDAGFNMDDSAILADKFGDDDEEVADEDEERRPLGAMSSDRRRPSDGRSFGRSHDDDGYGRNRTSSLDRFPVPRSRDFDRGAGSFSRGRPFDHNREEGRFSGRRSSDYNRDEGHVSRGSTSEFNRGEERFSRGRSLDRAGEDRFPRAQRRDWSSPSEPGEVEDEFDERPWARPAKTFDSPRGGESFERGGRERRRFDGPSYGGDRDDGDRYRSWTPRYRAGSGGGRDRSGSGSALPPTGGYGDSEGSGRRRSIYMRPVY